MLVRVGVVCSLPLGSEAADDCGTGSDELHEAATSASATVAAATRTRAGFERRREDMCTCQRSRTADSSGPRAAVRPEV